MIRKHLYIVLFQIVLFTGFAQVGSPTLMQTCFHETNCYHTKQQAHLFFDEGKNEFSVKMEFKQSPNQYDSLSKWVQGIRNFLYTAHLEKNQFPEPGNYKSKTVPLNGMLTVNGITKEQKIDITIFEIESYISRRGYNDFYDRYRVDFSIPVVPGDFDLGSDLKGTIFIAVSSGILNVVNAATRVDR